MAKDKPTEIIKGVNQMVEALFIQNNLKDSDVVSILFSITKDLKSMNPAAALRQKGYSNIPLFCTQEPTVHRSMKRMIRVLITFNSETDREVIPVYINGAEKLRPDLVR